MPDFDQVRRWMFHRALPFWADAGVDRERGGFHEALDLFGHPTVDGHRRLRVTCRQIYVFSHAATLGWKDGLPLARDGFAWLVDKGWLPRGGWAKLLTPDGAVADDTPDLYDHAFVLFALGWLHRAGGDAEALAWAHKTVDYLEGHLRLPGAPGFLHARPAAGWRLQNPHMHLLEAALVLYETSQDGRFAALAAETATLFMAKFFDRRTGTLAESFTEDLARAPGEDGRLVEPGHHFEWAWILARYQRLLGQPMGTVARSLVAFAERYGVDPVVGHTYNVLRDDGVPVDRGSRTWPNTERIKGHIALFELDGTDPRVPLTHATRVLLDRYLAHRPAGTWMDHFDGDGNPVASTIPASTLYHVFLAFAELLRVEPALRGLARRAAASVEEAPAVGLVRATG